MPVQQRFNVPPDQASATLAEAGDAMSALLVLDAHIDHHIAWLSRSAEGIGIAPGGDDAIKDARAVVNVQLEQMRALRRDLADLAAAAEAALPSGQSREEEIVRDRFLPPLPPGLGAAELKLVQQSFAHGMVAFCRDATNALGPLNKRLNSFDDEESGPLAKRAHTFLSALHAPGA